MQWAYVKFYIISLLTLWTASTWLCSLHGAPRVWDFCKRSPAAIGLWVECKAHEPTKSSVIWWVIKCSSVTDRGRSSSIRWNPNTDTNKTQNQPQRDGRLSRPAATGQDSNMQPHDCKSDTLPHVQPLAHLSDQFPRCIRHFVISRRHQLLSFLDAPWRHEQIVYL